MEQTSPPMVLHGIPPPPVPVSMRSGFISQNLQSGGTVLQQLFTTAQEESRKACQNFMQIKRLSAYKDHGYIFLFSYYPVQPVLQRGPICGLVALSMASQLAKDSYVTTEEILLEAKQRGYSKQGEMFSASSLEDLAAHFLPCKVEQVYLQHSEAKMCLDGRGLAEQLMKRKLILIPYDADKNHGPCQKQGHKAHWALLTGFFIAIKASEVPEELLSPCKRELEVPLLYYWPEDPEIYDQLTRLTFEKAGEIFVLGHHGKSKYAGLWPLQDLLLSNSNLMEAGPERSCDEYVIPSGGVEAGLRSQALIIHVRPQR